MENFNLGSLEKQVKCQYTDMKGAFAIDFHDNMSPLYTLIESKGVNTDQILIVGYRIEEGECRFGLTSNNCCLTVYYFEHNAGEDYSKIHRDMRANKQKPKRMEVNILYTELFAIIKRLDLIAVTTMNDLDLDFTEN